MSDTNLVIADDVEVKTTTELLEQRQEVLAIANQYGYSGSIAPDVLEENIRQSSQRIGMEMIGIGASLKMLKLQCGHGEFMTRVERTGFNFNSAKKMMVVADKFSNWSTSTNLEGLSKSKILELAIELDKDEVDQLMSGEDVRGLNVDDVRLKTVRELREALQAKDKEIADAKANYEAQLKRTGDKQSEVDQKNRAIDDLNAELKKRRLEFDAVTPEQAGRDLYEALTLTQVDALSKIRSLTAIVAELKAHGTTHEVSHDDFISGQLLNLQTAISEIREYHNIKAMPTGDIRPAWVTQSEADLEAIAEAQIAASGLGI